MTHAHAFCIPFEPRSLDKRTLVYYSSRGLSVVPYDTRHAANNVGTIAATGITPHTNCYGGP